MNIIEELYHGAIRPTEQCFDHDSQYAKFMRIVSDNESKLMKYLEAQENSKEEQHLLTQMMNAQREILCFSEENRFMDGFQLGARFILDTFIIPQHSVIRDIC